MFERYSIRFGEIYKLHPKKSENILRDIYFYVNFFENASTQAHRKYKRVSVMLLGEYGLNLPPRVIKRWYDRLVANQHNDL